MNHTYYTITSTPEIQGEAYNLWQPAGSTNKKLQIDSSITSNWKYRQYMEKNANDIMKYNTMQSINSSGNNPYTILNTQPTGNTPYLYKSIHSSINPSYGFRNSDLKQDYMNKEQLKSRMVAPTIPTNL